MKVFVVAAVMAAAFGGTAARADHLTLACLDLGRMVDACRASAARFEAETEHTVRVVSANATGRAALDGYRTLFDVASPRLDVVQLADSWVPALAGDLATLPTPEDELAVPSVAAVGREGSRLVALPQNVAITLMFVRTDVVGSETDAWGDLRQRLAAGPADGPAGLAFGAAGPSLFPTFLDFLYSYGASGLDDREALATALNSMDNAIGSVAEASVTSATPRDALTSFTDGNAAALIARSTVASAVEAAPIGENVAITTRPGGDPTTRILMSSWFVGVSRHSRATDAAIALARFLTSAEEERRAAVEFGIAPARPELYREPEIVGARPEFARIASILNRAVAPPVGEYGVAYLSLADDVADAVRRMLRGEAEPEPTAAAILTAVRRARQVTQ